PRGRAGPGAGRARPRRRSLAPWRGARGRSLLRRPPLAPGRPRPLGLGRHPGRGRAGARAGARRLRRPGRPGRRRHAGRPAGAAPVVGRPPGPGPVLVERLVEWRAQGRELAPELRRHRLGRRAPDEDPQALLEPVAPAAVAALGEVLLGLEPLALVEHAVKEGLHQLLALLAGVGPEGVQRHSAPPTAWAASSRLRIRRPRCRRDITVPTGMSRIWAASAYEKSPMSTSTTTSRKSCGTVESAATTSSCDRRSTTASWSLPPSRPASSSRL